MSSNLANVYANLLRKYGENFMITYSAAPSYLNSIVGASENLGKVILFYIEDRCKSKALNFVSTSKLNIKESNNNLDLTGSPLKDDCEVEMIGDMSLDLSLLTKTPWKPEEEYHKGVSIDKARAIITSEDFQTSSIAAEAIGSVWFLCTGADFSKTLFLQYEFERNFRSRGIINYMGVLAANEVTTKSLREQHCAVAGRNVHVETQIENTYNVKSNIFIKCSWSSVSLAPPLIELRTCDVVLKQSFCLSDSNPFTIDLINQLRLLKTIREEIMSYKLSEYSETAKEPVYACGIGIDMVDLRENINKIMTEIPEADLSSDAKRDILDVIQNAKIRRLNNVTDKLWEVLKKCSSYKDLKMAYNILFQCAACCNFVNTPTNKNRLAEIITDVANRRLAIPCLSGSEPLELLLEIGLEKLYRDYEYIFVESKICSANDLKNKCTAHDNKEIDAVVPTVRKSLRNAAVIQDNAALRKTLFHNDINSSGNKINNDVVCFKNSNFDKHESAKTLAKLWQIHCALEHLLMIHINLNSSNILYVVCDQLLRKIPRFVDVISDSLVDEMEIQISAHYVREHLEGTDPQSRRITMISKGKLREVKSTFYFSMENVCPPNVAECFKAEKNEYNKENVYHNWLYRKITTAKIH